MTKIKFFSIALAALFCQGVFVQAQQQPNKSPSKTGQDDNLVKQIEKYSKSVEDFVNGEGGPHLIVADVSDYNNSENPVWKTYLTEAEFEAARESEESYQTAYIWMKEGIPLAVNITYSSPSGDWVQYMYYIFRNDGSLAKLTRDFRTFMGDIIIEQVYYYDNIGKILRQSKNFRDLNTGNPIPEPEDFLDIDSEVYTRLKKLPFAGELGKKETALTAKAVKHFIPPGFEVEDRVDGDLNGDSLPDAAIQAGSENAGEDDIRRILIVLFQTKGGQFNKAAQSDTIIRCRLCGGMLGGGPADIKISRGVLLISQMYGSREATSYLHRLRFEPATRRFRLIGEDISNFDRATGKSTSKSTNFLTGRQIITKEAYNEQTQKDVVVSKQRKTVARTKKYLEDIDYSDY